MAPLVEQAIKQFEKLQASAAAGAAGAVAAMDKAVRSLGMIVSGGILLAGGMAGLDILKEWTSRAMEMQNTMTQLGVTTQGTVAQLQNLHTVAAGIGGTTFALPERVQIAQDAALAGVRDRGQLAAALPAITQFADIAQSLRNLAPDQSVPAAIKLALQFGAPGSKDFNQALDFGGRALAATPGDPMALLRNISQLGQARQGLGPGLNEQAVFSLAALTTTLGVRGAGGLRAMIQDLVGKAPSASGRLSPQQDAILAIEKYGKGQFFQLGGQLSPLESILQTVARFALAQTNPRERTQTLAAAFPGIGGTIMPALSTPEGIARVQSMLQAFGPAGLDSTKINGMLDQSTVRTWQVFQATLSDIGTSIATGLVPILNPLATDLRNVAMVVGDFLQHNPELARMIGIFMAVGTAASLIAGPVLIAVGAFGLLAPVIAPVIAEAGGLAVIMGTIAPPLVAVAALTATVAVVFANWSAINKATGGGLTALQKARSGLGDTIGPFFRSVGDLAGALWSLFGGSDAVKGSFSGFNLILQPLIGMVDSLRDSIKWLSGTFETMAGWIKTLKAELPNLAKQLKDVPLVGGIVGQTGQGPGAAGPGLGSQSIPFWERAALGFAHGGAIGALGGLFGIGGGGGPVMPASRVQVAAPASGPQMHVHAGAITVPVTIHAAPGEDSRVLAEQIKVASREGLTEALEETLHRLSLHPSGLNPGPFGA